MALRICAATCGTIALPSALSRATRSDIPSASKPKPGSVRRSFPSAHSTQTACPHGSLSAPLAQAVVDRPPQTPGSARPLLRPSRGALTSSLWPARSAPVCSGRTGSALPGSRNRSVSALTTEPPPSAAPVDRAPSRLCARRCGCESCPSPASASSPVPPDTSPSGSSPTTARPSRPGASARAPTARAFSAPDLPAVRAAVALRCFRSPSASATAIRPSPPRPAGSPRHVSRQTSATASDRPAPAHRAPAASSSPLATIQTRMRSWGAPTAQAGIQNGRPA